MENSEQKKEGQEAAPQEKEGLQKPVPAIFKGTATPAPGAPSTDKPGPDKPAPKSEVSDKLSPDIKDKISKRPEGGPLKERKVHGSFLKNPKFVLLIIFIFILMAGLFVLQSHLELSKEKKHREMLSEQVSELLTEHKELQNELDEKTEELKKKGEKGQDGQTSDVSNEFKETLVKLESEKDKLAHENIVLVEELEQTKKVLSGLKQEIGQSQENKMESEKKIDDLERKEAILKARLRRLGIDMRATKLGGEKESEGFDAKVLVVEKIKQLVAINVGELEGVAPGAEFDIYKQGQLYGRIIIDEVHETVSLGRIVPGVGIGNVTEGMKAMIRR